MEIKENVKYYINVHKDWILNHEYDKLLSYCPFPYELCRALVNADIKFDSKLYKLGDIREALNSFTANELIYFATDLLSDDYNFEYVYGDTTLCFVNNLDPENPTFMDKRNFINFLYDVLIESTVDEDIDSLHPCWRVFLQANIPGIYDPLMREIFLLQSDNDSIKHIIAQLPAVESQDQPW